MTNKLSLGFSVAAFVLAGAVAIGFFWGGSVSKVFGAAGGLLAENYISYIRDNDGYKSEKGIVLSGADGDITTGDDLTVTDDATVTDDLTVSGGSLAVSTSNTATSTISGGCVQTTATSTATPIRILIGSNALATSTHTGATASGLVAWGYGSCPI